MLKKIIIILSLTLLNLYSIDLKNLSITGFVNYEIQDIRKDGSNNGEDKEAEHDIDLDLRFGYKFNKETEFVLRVDDDNTTDENGSSVNLITDQIYLKYKDKTMLAQFGLQEITGPFFYEQNGDGLLFLKPYGSNIVAVSYMVNNTFSDADEVLEAALVGERESLSYELWYASISNAAKTTDDYGAEAIRAMVYKEVDMLEAGIIYTTLNSSTTTSRTLQSDQTQIALYIKNEDEDIRYGFAYISTGKHGGNVALDEQTDSEANYSLDEVGANDVVDGNSYYGMFEKLFDDTEILTIKYFAGSGTTSADEIRVAFKKYFDKDIYCYIAANQWNKTNEDTSEKVEIGFNIVF